MKISTAMSRPAVSVTPETSIRSAAMLMWRHDIGALPVVENDRVIGIVTDRDIVVRTIPDRSGIEDRPVGDAMTGLPVTCAANLSVAEAAAIMGDKQVRRVPVVDRSGRLVGVLSIGDIAENVSEELAGERPWERSARTALAPRAMSVSDCRNDLGTEIVEVDFRDLGKPIDVVDGDIHAIARAHDLATPETAERAANVNRRKTDKVAEYLLSKWQVKLVSVDRALHARPQAQLADCIGDPRIGRALAQTKQALGDAGIAGCGPQIVDLLKIGVILHQPRPIGRGNERQRRVRKCDHIRR
jgi:CBS domain-containing protein